MNHPVTVELFVASWEMRLCRVGPADTTRGLVHHG